MDPDESLTALKRAYADIILNTAKEAAARIMLSERRALRFEFELNNAKEDALKMLLKLKQMMDYKISEAEMASCTQQKKIEELEAQLQEAEDIVKDLREELSSVQAELERFPLSQEVKHSVKVNGAPEKNVQTTPESIIFPPPESQSDLVPSSEMENSNIDQRNKGHGVYNSLFPLKKYYIGNAGLPAIILRSKETELFRNGCTHRIRACERTSLARERSFTEQTNDIKPESFAKEDEEGEKLRYAPSLGCDVEEKEEVQDDSRVSCRCQVDIDNSRKLAGPYRNKRPACQSQPMDEIKEMNRAASISCVTSVSSVKHVNDMAIEEKYDEDTYIDTDLVTACDSQGSIKAQVDLPLENSKSKALETIEVPVQLINDRVIKYTFQRKRKRGTLSIDGNVFTENLKRKDEEKQNAHLESEMANSIGESTRTKRCIEQIDHQLTSVSEKKRMAMNLVAP